MKVKEYFEILKEIKKTEKKEKVQLSENLVITILQEMGKDRRTRNYNKKPSQAPESPKKEQDKELATEKQKKALDRIGIDYDEDITKREAWKILNDYKNQNWDYWRD